jgi:hypothetical protein
MLHGFIESLVVGVLEKDLATGISTVGHVLALIGKKGWGSTGHRSRLSQLTSGRDKDWRKLNLDALFFILCIPQEFRL